MNPYFQPEDEILVTSQLAEFAAHLDNDSGDYDYLRCLIAYKDGDLREVSFLGAQVTLDVIKTFSAPGEGDLLRRILIVARTQGMKEAEVVKRVMERMCVLYRDQLSKGES